MSEHTNIQWCDSTFNPWIGCTRVSPACDDCYAARSTPARAMHVAWGSGETRHRTAAATWKQPLLWERHHEAFTLMHGRRRRVFCASLADVFDNEVPATWRAELFWLIALTPHLDWLLLTKRIGNAARMIDEALGSQWDRPEREAPLWRSPWPWPNVWLLATVADQDEADREISKLLAVPALVRGLSIEPMLGPIDLNRTRLRIQARRGQLARAINGEEWLDWVICGGESGAKARPMHPDWPRKLRDQCAAAGVPFLFKQWGAWVPGQKRTASLHALAGNLCRVTHDGVSADHYVAVDGNAKFSTRLDRFGKKAAGRALDGVEHNGFPFSEGA